MTALNKQALRQSAEKAQEHGVFNMDIHSETVLALLDELDKWQQESSTWKSVAEKQLAIAIEAEKRIADQQATLNAARSYVKAHAAGDGHAFGVLQAIDRAAGISVKGE